ncbi:MAG: hypothetical protein ACYDAO_05925 [Thermoplasmataceae archaeon]
MNNDEDLQVSSNFTNNNTKERIKRLIETLKDPSESDDDFIEKSILDAMEYRETGKNLELMYERVKSVLEDLKKREKTLSEEKRTFEHLNNHNFQNTQKPAYNTIPKEEIHRIHWNTKPIVKPQPRNSEIDELIRHLESRWAELDKLDLWKLKEIMKHYENNQDK